MRAGWSQGPSLGLCCHKHLLLPHLLSQECLALPSPTPPPPPHLALSGPKLQGMSLSSTAATMGKSQAPHPCHFSSERLTSGYPQLTLLTLFIFPWQQWPRKAQPTPTCPSTRKKKKKSQETKAVLNQQGQPTACGGPRSVPYLFLPTVFLYLGRSN